MQMLAIAVPLIIGIIAVLWNIGGQFLSVILFDVVMQNPILQAIIIPSAIGAFLYALNLVGTYVFSNYISPYLYSYITIRSSETEYFEAVLDFVQDQRLLKAGHLMACKSKGKSWKESMQQFLTGEKVLTDIHYRPANTGSFISMKYKGQTIYITRKSGETVTVGWERKVVQMETLSLSVFGTDPTIIKSFISDAIARVKQVKSEDVNIFVRSDGWPEGWIKVWEYVFPFKRSPRAELALSSLIHRCSARNRGRLTRWCWTTRSHKT
jgi:hypothetical protein